MLADNEVVQSAVAVAGVSIAALAAWVGYLTFKSNKRQRQQEADAADKTKAQDLRLRETELGQASLEGALARADIERERQDEHIESQDDRIEGLVADVRALRQEVRDERQECNRRLDLLVVQLHAAGIAPNPEARVQ